MILLIPFLETRVYTPAEEWDIVERYRKAADPKSSQPANAYLIVFDLSLQSSEAMAGRESLFAEFQTIEMDNLEPMYCDEEYRRWRWQLPWGFSAFDFGANCFRVGNNDDFLTVRGSLVAECLDGCVKFDVEADSLRNFCVYLSDRKGLVLRATKASMIPALSWALAQPCYLRPDMEDEAGKAMSCRDQ